MNFPSLGFPVPFLDVSIYPTFLGSCFKGRPHCGERKPYADLGLAVKIAPAADLYGSNTGFIDIGSQPLSGSSFSGKGPNSKTEFKGASTPNSHLGEQATGTAELLRETERDASVRDVK